MLDHPLEFAKRLERAAQLEVDVKGLLAGSAILWEIPKGLEGLLEVLYRLSVCRACSRLRPGSSKIGYRLVPHLATHGMERQQLHLLALAVGIERLERLDDPRVQGTPPFLEQAPVGDLVRERVLERVFEVREQP